MGLTSCCKGKFKSKRKPPKLLRGNSYAQQHMYKKKEAANYYRDCPDIQLSNSIPDSPSERVSRYMSTDTLRLRKENSDGTIGEELKNRPTYKTKNRPHHMLQSQSSSQGLLESENVSSSIDEILKILRHLLNKQEEEERAKGDLNEWREIAIVLDRYLFWMFTTVTAVSSALFLVILPIQKRGLADWPS